MKKKIENYMYLYIGCDIYTGTGTIELIGVIRSDFYETFDVVVMNGNVSYKMNWSSDCRLKLRSLSSMTEEDQSNLSRIDRAFAERYSNDQERAFLIEAQKIQYLLSKHFDLFGLIESGLAIETIK